MILWRRFRNNILWEQRAKERKGIYRIAPFAHISKGNEWKGKELLGAEENKIFGKEETNSFMNKKRVKREGGLLYTYLFD